MKGYAEEAAAYCGSPDTSRKPPLPSLRDIGTTFSEISTPAAEPKMRFASCGVTVSSNSTTYHLSSPYFARRSANLSLGGSIGRMLYARVDAAALSRDVTPVASCLPGAFFMVRWPIFLATSL